MPRETINVFWDSGSTLSFITNRMATQLKLRGKPIKLSLMTVGGTTTQLETQEYPLVIYDENDKEVVIQVIGIEKISSAIGAVDNKRLCLVFGLDEQQVCRPRSGEIDVLIGLQYAAYHPVPVQTCGHLILYSNRFGKTIGGSHPEICERTSIADYCAEVRHAVAMHAQSIDTFFEVESLGVNCSPRCGACACGKCHPGGKAMSLKDEAELELIERKLSFNVKTGRWLAEYPWIRKPTELHNNRRIAIAKLCSTEKRLQKNPDYMSIYAAQIDDLLDRKVARRVTRAELETYEGPTYYLAHHAILKPESKSTPCRIVFDSKAQYMGLSLNDCLAKGPSLLNALLGVLLRFRKERFAFIGDISKMYHSIDIPVEDQMMHLFLWRDCVNRPPETYAITAVNMGDRPSATIAQTALRKTAEKAAGEFPKAADIIVSNSYMDDISGSEETKAEACARMEEISDILKAGSFKIKEWVHNVPRNEVDASRIKQVPLGLDEEAATEGVLGLRWNAEMDTLHFKFKTQRRFPEGHTKRSILSAANSIYDPLGLLTPFTSKVKILMRGVWAHEPRLGWDTPLPERIKQQWSETMTEIPLLTGLSFQRALTPQDAVGKPSLIVFSDGSENAYGAVAYARWKMEDGSYEARLVMSKSRVAPLKTVDIVRIELSGAVLSARLRASIQRDLQMCFEKVIHLTDSEIVHAMIQRQSYGYNTFAANRVGEIHQSTHIGEWAWVSGKLNIADVTTRGCSPCNLSADTEWQQGPEFLKDEESVWPIKFEVNRDVQVPELRGSLKTGETAIHGEEHKLAAFVGTTCEKETLATRIDAKRHSSWLFLKSVTARVLKLYKRFQANSQTDSRAANIDSSDLRAAENFWLKYAQQSIEAKKYAKFKPVLDDNGIILVGGRTERWMASTWNQQRFVLLPKDSYISLLVARYEHARGGHLGVAASISKIRSKYWIIGVRRMVKGVIRDCRHCKEKLKARQAQVMSPLPIERIKPSPAFNTVGVDYFGPFSTKGEVQKRVRGKSYGVIFACFSSRAVYADVAHDASTDGFLQVLRRFTSLRGWPSKFYSDNGTQLVGASNEMKGTIRSLGWEEIKKFGQPFDSEWEFSPPDAPWYNGATEALVKSVKRALNASIGETTLQFSELQTIMFEAAELVNERPIGVHPDSPEDGVYLCPNDLLLGRASNKVPQGPFMERTSDKYRFDFLQKLVTTFWKRWTRDVFPNLVMEPKWHVQQRNLKAGDVVLVQDANAVRGRWKMALVEASKVSADGKVRRVDISYKSAEGTRITVERAVQRLIVLVANDN